MENKYPSKRQQCLCTWPNTSSISTQWRTKHHFSLLWRSSSMRGKICRFTTLEFICSVFAVFLAVTQPHAGDAVPTWTGKVAFLALLPMGNCHEQQNQVSLWGINNDWGHYLFLSSLWIPHSTVIIISKNDICLKSILIEDGFLNLFLNAHAKCVCRCVGCTPWQLVSSA